MEKAVLNQFRQSVENENLGVYGVHVYKKDAGVAEHRFRSDDYLNINSCSKTYTAVAVGICADAGLLSLEDKLVKFFPECTDIISEGTEAISIRNLLQMMSGKNLGESTMDLIHQNTEDMAEIFFKGKMDSAPGTEFFYCNLGTYMLGRAVERVSGKALRDFLVERLFSKMGMPNPQWMSCANGHTAAASGLMLKTSQLAMLGRFLLQEGSWKGEQLLSTDYVKAMHTDVVDTSHFGDSETQCGYGYQVWRCSVGQAWRADGLYGQFSIIIPEKDAVVTVTSHNERHPYDIIRAIFSDIVPLI